MTFSNCFWFEELNGPTNISFEFRRKNSLSKRLFHKLLECCFMFTWERKHWLNHLTTKTNRCVLSLFVAFRAVSRVIGSEKFFSSQSERSCVSREINLKSSILDLLAQPYSALTLRNCPATWILNSLKSSDEIAYSRWDFSFISSKTHRKSEVVICYSFIVLYRIRINRINKWIWKSPLEYSCKTCCDNLLGCQTIIPVWNLDNFYPEKQFEFYYVQTLINEMLFFLETFRFCFVMLRGAD